jgi:hypothetical protein
MRQIPIVIAVATMLAIGALRATILDRGMFYWSPARRVDDDDADRFEALKCHLRICTLEPPPRTGFYATLAQQNEKQIISLHHANLNAANILYPMRTAREPRNTATAGRRDGCRR